MVTINEAKGQVKNVVIENFGVEPFKVQDIIDYLPELGLRQVGDVMKHLVEEEFVGITNDSDKPVYEQIFKLLDSDAELENEVWADEVEEEEIKTIFCINGNEVDSIIGRSVAPDEAREHMENYINLDEVEVTTDREGNITTYNYKVQSGSKAAAKEATTTAETTTLETLTTPIEPRARIELTKNTKGYNWSVKIKGDDTKELLTELKTVNDDLVKKYSE